MTRRFALRLALLVMVLTIASLAGTACQAATPAPTAVPPTVAPTKAPAYPTGPVTMIVPSKPGSGLDTTARAVALALEQEKLLPVALPIENYGNPNEALSLLITKRKGDANTLVSGSLSVMTAKTMGGITYGYKEFTSIARLYSTYAGFIVRAESPYKTVNELLKDLKDNPGQTPICGGLTDDRFLYAAAVQASGGDPTKVNYAAFNGGTEAAATLMEGTVKAEVSSLDEIMGLIEAGKLRVLAVSGPTRLTGVLANVPTLKEAGVNVEWTNFRYIGGPPDMPAYALKYWQDTLGKMVKTTTWKDTVTKNRWVDSFLVEGFDKFLDEQSVAIDKLAVTLGLKK